MTGFETLHLPRGFVLQEEEIGTVDDPSLPSLGVPRLTPSRLRALIQALRASRERIAGFPVSRITGAVDAVARRLLSPDDRLRQRALRHLGPHAGLSDPMARVVVDGMARDWTRERLDELLVSEFRDPRVLDGFLAQAGRGRTRALGFPLTFHLGAGTVPGVAVTSMIRGLLVKSAVLLKPGRGDVVLPKLFADGLAEEDPELADAVAVLYWPREPSLMEVALEEADLVVVFGGDDTVRRVRDVLPTSTPLLAFRHRIGIGYIGRGRAEGRSASELVDAARAVAVFDQRGCVSPHAFLVDRGGEVPPEEWAGGLASALEELEEELPSGPLTPEEGAVLYQLRGVGEVEAGAGQGEVYHGGPDASWTVLYQPGGTLQPSCLGRTVRVIPVDGFDEAAEMLRPWAAYLQTVGVARLGEEREGILEGLARLGVSRVVDFSGVPWPPPWWHQDGVSPLRSMVRWTDAEERADDG